VIVRIATEDQYEVSQTDYERVNDLDNAVVAAVEAGDEERFHTVFDSLLDFVRSEGHPVADDVLEESDVILPPPDLTFEDLTALGEGGDDIDRQLKELTSSSAVDDEMAKLRAEIGSGAPEAPAGELGTGSPEPAAEPTEERPQ